MNFGSSGGGGGGGNSGATAGQDLDQIETEQIAFQTPSGEDKLRLLPSPWPSNNLPSTTSSLLSIASAKGLLAAASPDTLVIASTDSVRDTFKNGEADGDKVKSFTPQATISIPRVSQVMFSSDESCLVISAEQGGGLAVYDTNALTNGGKESAFQLATEGQSVRQLLPNPNPSAESSRYFGMVTENGQLLLADLKEQKLVQSSSASTIFHEKVSCACWSRLGKQIVAGLADGTAVQIDQQGVVKATIPEPPQLGDIKANSSAVAHPVTSIFWLDTHDFLIIHTPINQDSSDGMPNDDSTYHLAHRDKASGNFTFSKFEDPCTPFGMDSRKPANHFVLRLREWLSLSDMLILSSTASTDIGIFTRSKTALDPNHVPSTGNDTFTYTRPPDARRAEMPMGAESDTSPIGMALDLSVKEKIARPIPMDETLDESPVPLPALMVLNNEGMLSQWYVVYNESIRQAQPYPDLVAAGGPRSLGGSTEQRPQSQPQQQSQTQQNNAFGSLSLGTPASTSSPFASSTQTTSAFGQPSTFGGMGSQTKSPFGMQSQQQQSQSTFGTPSQPTSTFGQSSQTPSTFGQPSATAFGGASSLGSKQSPWGGNATPTAATGGPAFGKPAFGASTSGQPSAFGQAGGGMGTNRGSVWGTPQGSQQQQQSTQQQTPGATFGSGSVFGGNASQSSPFMSLGGTQNQTRDQSPFAAAAKTGSLSNQSSSSGSAFGSLGSANQTSASPFATASKPSLPGDQSGSTVSFGSGMSFGSGNTSFGVQSLNSPTPTPTQQQSQTREESMEDEDEKSETSTLKPGTTGGIGGAFSGFKLGSTFKGDGTAKDDLPKPKDAGAGLFGKNFGEALDSSAALKPRDQSQSGSEGAWWSGMSTPVGNGNVQVKKEPGTEEQPKLSDIPPAPTQREAPVDDAPLPPDPTTWKPKPGALPAPVPPGFESTFSKKEEKKVDDAPLPPDPTPAPAAANVPAPDDGPDDQLSEEPQSPEQSEEADGPPESGDEEGEWSDEDEGDEADEDDDALEDDEEDHTPDVVEDAKGLSAFESRLTPASPKRSQAKPQESPSSTRKEDSTTPATEPKKQSYTPAGMPKAPVMFQPSQGRVQESPRSPSPQRNVTSPARAMGSAFGTNSQQTSSSTYGKPSAVPQQPLSQQPLSQPSHLPPPSQPRTTSLLPEPKDASRAAAPPQTMPQSQTQQPQRISVPAAQLVSQSQKTSSTPSKPAEPTQGTLEDEEDARIQSILAAPIEPTQDVPAFLAHQDYVALSGHQEKEGLGGQIERVFRDVNSMIDTLALNARALKGFVQGNEGSQQSRSRLDLEEEEGWVLGEAGELGAIMEGVDVELEDGRLEDVKGAIEGLREEEKELSRLRVKCAEVRKSIAVRMDPNQIAQRDSAPLSMETQAQQTELREQAKAFQERLAEAEQVLSVLRAELASLPSSGSDGADGGRRQVPTVEAVMNTIRKMTSMIEKKSGDIDVLESQIRKLGGPAALGLKTNYEDDLVAGLKASRLSHSSPTAFKGSRASMFGSPAQKRLAASRSSPSPGAWGKKSLFDVPDQELEVYRAKKEGRRRAMERLREQLEVRGTRVVKVSE